MVNTYFRVTFVGKIKKLCETELDIVSQCINPKSPKNKQYFENVALKINVKVSAFYCFLLSGVLQLSWKMDFFLCVYQVGGCNTLLEMPKGIPFVPDAPTIIFGADVTHPVAGEDSSASIAAVSFLFSAGIVSFKCCSN